MEPIRNKVAESGILTLDLAPYTVADADVMAFDLKPFLFREMILREKDYREALKTLDFSTYSGKHIALQCSVDAIIPVWAYMLATTYLQPIALSVSFGTVQEVKNLILMRNLALINAEDYRDQRVVLKGCGDTPIPEAAYTTASAMLTPLVKSLMYGEPCSTVPIYKKKRVIV